MLHVIRRCTKLFFELKGAWAVIINALKEIFW